MRPIFFIIIFGLLAVGSAAQSSPYKIVVAGQIIDKNTGFPLPDQDLTIRSKEVFIKNRIFEQRIKTNEDGMFFDTIYSKSNTGALYFETSFCENLSADTTVYYRFTNPGVIYISPLFELDICDSTNGFYVQIGQQVDQKDPLKVHYGLQTNADFIISLSWDFKDGLLLEKLNPEYTFQQSGVHMVTVRILAFYGGEFHYKIINRVSVVYDHYFYHLGGNVYHGDFPVEAAEVYLYEVVAPGSIVPLDTATIDTLGYYYFYGLEEATYILKAIPAAFNSYMPTYYGNTLTWPEAVKLVHNEIKWDADIHLIPSILAPLTGSFSVSGWVEMSDSQTQLFDVRVPNAEVLLMDDLYKPIAYTMTDFNGNFSIGRLPEGSYSILADQTGKNCEIQTFYLSDDQPVLSSIELELENNPTSVGEAAYSKNSLVRMYPVPFESEINLQWLSDLPSQATELTLISLQGQALYQEIIHYSRWNETVKITLPEIPTGIYIIRLSNNHFNESFRIIKK